MIDLLSMSRVAGSAGPAEEQLRSAVQDEGYTDFQVNPPGFPTAGCDIIAASWTAEFILASRQQCFCLLCFSKMKGSDNQEKLVYQVIEDAGNKGNTLMQNT